MNTKLGRYSDPHCILIVHSLFQDQTDDGAADADVEVETEKTLLGFMKPKKTSKSTKKVLSIDGQAPIRIPPIYDGTRLLVYRIFSATEQVMELPTLGTTY